MCQSYVGNNAKALSIRATVLRHSRTARECCVAPILVGLAARRVCLQQAEQVVSPVVSVYASKIPAPTNRP